MRYHLVLTDEHGHCVGVRTVDGHAAADREARSVVADVTGWTPTRYPGRSWRRGETAVFVDRRNSLRRELSVLRCPVDHETAPLECPLRSLGIPALNLEPVAGSPPTPVDYARHILVR